VREVAKTVLAAAHADWHLKKLGYSTHVQAGCQKYKRGLTMLLLWIALVWDV